MNLIRIWKSKEQILEGITNSVFKKEHVEEIAAERMKICKECGLYDETGSGCMVPGTGPCCNIIKGGCGCTLNLKTRSLSSNCPHPDGPKWLSELSIEEEAALKKII